MTSTAVIAHLRIHFCRHGAPDSLRTDNGPQFISAEFVDFLQEFGIQHRRNTPLWPRANGEVERQNRTLLKTLKIAQLENKSWQVELQHFLLAYRSTSRSTTGETPAKLFFNREVQTKLPTFHTDQTADSFARNNDASRKQII